MGTGGALGCPARRYLLLVASGPRSEPKRSGRHRSLCWQGGCSHSLARKDQWHHLAAKRGTHRSPQSVGRSPKPTFAHLATGLQTCASIRYEYCANGARGMAADQFGSNSRRTLSCGRRLPRLTGTSTTAAASVDTGAGSGSADDEAAAGMKRPCNM
jgi:hypothetical protein